MTEMSKVFSSGYYREVEKNIAQLINAKDDWLSEEVSNSTRAIGDGIQEIISSDFYKLIGEEYCKSYSSDFSRRSMEDLAFEDHDGFYYAIDVKTHNLDTAFSMPNLTSVKRLSRFYESNHNYFVLLVVSYKTQSLKIIAQDVKFIPIEYIDWQCLTIGALGWGQIQISDAHNLIINDHSDRAAWMIELCDRLLDFYQGEVSKIDSRVQYFTDVKEKWYSKT